jgi:hypothetical protein
MMECKNLSKIKKIRKRDDDDENFTLTRDKPKKDEAI